MSKAAQPAEVLGPHEQQHITSGALAHGTPAHLLPETYKRIIAGWLEEDTPSFDYGGFVVGEADVDARLLGKSAGIVAGVPFFNEVFRQLGCRVEWHVAEGTVIEPVTHCATVRGPARKVLLGERVALNTLARCSGIATQSAELVRYVRGLEAEAEALKAARSKNGAAARAAPILIAGTRKTTPGFRVPEKYAMLVGGVDPHRHDLSAMTMLKDNHIWACGGDIARAVGAARAAGGFAVKVEVEVASEADAERAVRAGADVVMLDNFAPGVVGAVARRLKRKLGTRAGGEGFKFLIEVSGGLTAENIKGYLGLEEDDAHEPSGGGSGSGGLERDGIDILSTSSVHQGVKHVDFSLKVVPAPAAA